MTNKMVPIKPKDVEQLMVIEEACHSHPWSNKTFTSCIGGRYFGYKLLADNKCIGFYVGEHVAGEATLMDICTSPASQGKGYGQLLLSHFIEQAKILSNDKLWLEVRAKNFAAQMLYIKNGFEEVSRRTGYYPSVGDFGGYEDAIIMSFNLAKSNLKQTRKSPLKTVKKPRNKR